MDDLISRQEAIDAIKELCKYYTPTKSVTHPHMDFVIEELQKLPSIQSRKGKWIKTDRWDEVCDTLCECSECHSFVLVEEDYKYCPYCGADMREGDA